MLISGHYLTVLIYPKFIVLLGFLTLLISIFTIIPRELKGEQNYLISFNLTFIILFNNLLNYNLKWDIFSWRTMDNWAI